MSTKTGAHLVVEALEEKGVSKIFTLSGGHITPIYQQLEHSSIELVDTRHEQAAVFMAEAWGKMTRETATVMVTAGPGFTNALTGIASANLSNSPLVLISGAVGFETKDKLDLQDMDQLPVIKPMVKKALVCGKSERAAEYIDMAYRIASSGRPGPVYLEFPVDILNGEVDETKVTKPHTVMTTAPCDTEGAKKLMEMLEKAKKPMVIGGSGTWFSDAGREITTFIENWGIPFYTMAMGRGVVSDEHPLCFESALAIRPGSGFLASGNTDLVVVLGSRFNLFNIFGSIYNKDAKVVQVDIHPEEIGRNRSVDLGIVSDIKPFIAACNTIAEEMNCNSRMQEQFKPWVDQLTKNDHDAKNLAMLNWKKEGEPIHPLRLAHEINQFMDRDDDIVVADGGDTTTWNGMTRTIKRPGHYLDYGLYGSLAVGLPYANAAKLLYPEKRVLLLTGDGSVGFNFMEFETSLRKKLPIVVVISNDQGWGMIRHSQEIRMGHAIKDGTWIGWVDYHKLVEALGGKGYLVEKPEDIRPALEDAFASGTTCCINVSTDITTVSPGSVALANLGGYKA